MDEPGVVGQIGFLYSSYHSSQWWFELVDMFHKLFLTSILPIITPLREYHTQIAMFIACIYLGILLILMPYLRKGDDRLHLWAQIELLILLSAGLTFKETHTSTSLEFFVVFIMCSTIIFFYLFFFAQLIQVVIKKYKLWKEGAAEDTTMETCCRYFGIRRESKNNEKNPDLEDNTILENPE